MKCFAASPDLGAEESHNGQTHLAAAVLTCNEQKDTKREKHAVQELHQRVQTLTHSPIAAMWYCDLDVRLHNGLVHGADGVVIRTVSIQRVVVSWSTHVVIQYTALYSTRLRFALECTIFVRAQADVARSQTSEVTFTITRITHGR